MPIIETVKVNGVPVPGVVRKVATEGDVYRFAAAESGKRQIVGLQDTSGRVVAGAGYYDITLDFNYLVGVKQVKAAVVDPVVGDMKYLPDGDTIRTALAATGANFPGSFTLSALLYFDEVSANVVRVYNVSSATILLFEVPHTSTPAEIIRRLLVQRQGDNIAVELLGDGDGIILRAPNGRRALLRVTNNMTMSVTPR